VIRLKIKADLICFTSPAGAGKDTQAEIFKSRFGFEVITMSEELRKLGELKEGSAGLSSNKVVDLIIEETVEAVANSTGQVILNGAPRDEHQARKILALGRQHNILVRIIVIKASDETCQRRIAARVRKQKEEHLKDRTKPAPRGDDQPEVVAERLRIYHANAFAIRAAVREIDPLALREVDGEGTKAEVTELIVQELQ
jgi:adenylate kinase family enzyme